MGRWIILGIVVVVALTIYAVVDCAMSDNNRTRIFRKPIWLVIALLLPVIGPLLWIFMGKGGETTAQRAPDNDPDYLSSLGQDDAHDARIRELEEEMRKLDDEIAQARKSSMDQHPSNHTGNVPVIELDATSGESDFNDSKHKGPDSDSEGSKQ